MAAEPVAGGAGRDRHSAARQHCCRKGSTLSATGQSNSTFPSGSPCTGSPPPIRSTSRCSGHSASNGRWRCMCCTHRRGCGRRSQAATWRSLATSTPPRPPRWIRCSAHGAETAVSCRRCWAMPGSPAPPPRPKGGSPSHCSPGSRPTSRTTARLSSNPTRVTTAPSRSTSPTGRGVRWRSPGTSSCTYSPMTRRSSRGTSSS